MYILDIIPLQKGIPRDTLSYYSVRDIALGTLVEIPLHSKTIHGIVINSAPARDLKASIRSGSFSLKAVGPIINPKGFPQSILQVMETISRDTLIPIGTLVSNLFPEQSFSFFQEWKALTREHAEVRIAELPTSDHIDYCKQAVREAFAKKHSILFVSPTVIEQNELVLSLKEIHGDCVVALSGSVPAAKREKVYKTIKENPEPLIICATPQMFLVPRADIATCVVTSAGSNQYIQDFRQRIDFRSVIVRMNKLMGYATCMLDSFSQPEQQLLLDTRDAFIDRTSKKPVSTAKIVIAQKENVRDPLFVSPVLSSTTVELIKQAQKQNQPIFIYTARKGVATFTACRDCGYTVHCPNCNNIMQLIKKNPLADADRVFSCNRCSTEVPAMNRCPNCLGWNIIPMGITAEAITDELKRLFPDSTLFQGSHDHVKTDAAARKVVTTWKESGDILIGTSRIIPFIPTTTVTIVASFEHMMSIPTYNTPMNTLWLLQNLYEKTSHYFCIQTKDVDNSLLTGFAKQDLKSVVYEDSALRKEYHYPPFTTLITIEFDKIKRKDHLQAKDYLKKALAEFEHTIQVQFFEYGQYYVITAKVHIPVDDWQDRENESVRRLSNFLGSIRSHADVAIETAWM